MMNGAYQRTMLTPGAMLNQMPIPDSVAQFARFGTEAAGRTPNSFLQFLQKEFPNRSPAPYR